jgi:predicted RNase H-like nuclease (RuvC/YqgF family)
MSENDKTSPPDIRDPDWLLRRIHKFRQEVQHVEREYLEMRVRVHYLKRRMEELEQRHPWLVSGKAPEIAFWAPPAG